MVLEVIQKIELGPLNEMSFSQLQGQSIVAGDD